MGKQGMESFKCVFSESTPFMYFMVNQRFEGSEDGWESRIPDCPSSLPMSWSLAYCSASLKPLKQNRQGELGGPWLVRKENRFLAPSTLVHKIIYASGNFQCCQDLSCLLSIRSPDPGSQALEKRIFFGWLIGAEGGNQILGYLNAKCISLIYSNKFSSGYFLYYQTLYPSVKTFVLAE